MVQRWHR